MRLWFLACPPPFEGALTSSVDRDPFVAAVESALSSKRGRWYAKPPALGGADAADKVGLPMVALPFDAVPISPMTPSYDPMVVKLATTAFPLPVVAAVGRALRHLKGQTLPE